MSDSEDAPGLNDEIVTALDSSGFDSGTEFLPECKVQELTSEKKIRQYFPNISDDLVRFINQDAKRVFLTAVHILGDGKAMKQMKRFQEHGITDAELPIDEIHCNNTCCELQKDFQSECTHSAALNVFHRLNFTKTKRFCQAQRSFNSPVFKHDELGQHFHENCILPFKKPVIFDQNGGHFSFVHKAILRSDHLLGFKGCKKGDGVCVAVKQLKDLKNEPGYDVRRAWKLEVDALNGIDSICDSHLIDRIAAFTRGEQHFIIFEWADGGTLRDVWEKEPDIHLKLKRGHVQWLIQQMLGLVRALYKLHNPERSSIEEPVDRQRSGPQILVTDTDGGPAETRNWRHGDLKPDNILAFASDSRECGFGILKIADLGLAKQHQHATLNREEATGTKHSTLQYEAPEVTTRPKLPRSRLYDIWSMGCIIFESVIWLLTGKEGLEALKPKEPLNSGDTIYFTVQDRLGDIKSAEQSQFFKDVVQDLLKNDPECNGKPTAIRDLLMLVRDRLLVVDLPLGSGSSSAPSIHYRAGAGELKRALSLIWERGQNDEGYLLATSNRATIPLPVSLSLADRRRDSGFALGTSPPDQNVGHNEFLHALSKMTNGQL